MGTFRAVELERLDPGLRFVLAGKEPTVGLDGGKAVEGFVGVRFAGLTAGTLAFKMGAEAVTFGATGAA